MSLPAAPRSFAASQPPPEAAAVVAYWREVGPELWFGRDPAFAVSFRTRFLMLHDAAARGVAAHWATTAEGALALILLLDQFPRHAFRGTRRMYATDARARAAARAAIAIGQDLEVSAMLRLFFYLPFGHSENLADQELCVALCGHLPPPHPRQAAGRRDTLLRFGRFPDRNAILGREMTAAEARFLAAGGYAD